MAMTAEAGEPRTKFRKATSMIVAMNRMCGVADDEIRATVRRAIKEALAGQGEWKMTHRGLVPTAKFDPQDPLAMANLYRMVIAEEQLDWTDQRKQESFYALVVADLENALRVGIGPDGI